MLQLPQQTINILRILIAAKYPRVLLQTILMPPAQNIDHMPGKDMLSGSGERGDVVVP